MRAYVIILICGLVSLAKVSTKRVNTAIPAKRYKVDLDVPASKRWIPVLQNFNASQLLAVLHKVEKSFIKNKELIALVEDISNDLVKYFPQPYADEIQGIADFYNQDVGKIVMVNLAYDASAWNSIGLGLMGCTSIVTMDKDGGIIHGRNLDYTASDELRDITVEVEFHHSGKTAFVSTTYVAYIGVLTAMKPNAFTISGDERDVGSLWENIISAFEKHWPTMLMTREVVTHADSYDTALQMLAKADTIAPMYLIVGGMKPREGAIVVRDRWGSVNITRMEDTTDKWFVLETNYDPWNKPPASDDRRDTGVYAMEVFGQARMDVDNLYGVLSIPPVLNSDTTYTTIMSAADPSVYRTLVRYDHPDEEN